MHRDIQYLSLMRFYELAYLFFVPFPNKPFSVLLFQPFLTQTEVPVGGPTVDGVDSVCWWQKPAVLSAFARKNAGPPLCQCVARTAGSTRTTARFTAPPAWRGDGSMWCTARTASSKVSLDCYTETLTLQRAATHCRKCNSTSYLKVPAAACLKSQINFYN